MYIVKLASVINRCPYNNVKEKLTKLAHKLIFTRYAYLGVSKHKVPQIFESEIGAAGKYERDIKQFIKNYNMASTSWVEAEKKEEQKQTMLKEFDQALAEYNNSKSEESAAKLKQLKIDIGNLNQEMASIATMQAGGKELDAEAKKFKMLIKAAKMAHFKIIAPLYAKLRLTESLKEKMAITNEAKRKQIKVPGLGSVSAVALDFMLQLLYTTGFFKQKIRKLNSGEKQFVSDFFDIKENVMFNKDNPDQRIRTTPWTREQGGWQKSKETGKSKGLQTLENLFQ